MNRRSCTLAAVAIGMAMLAGRTLADPSVCHKLFPTESCSGHDPFPNIPNDHVIDIQFMAAPVFEAVKGNLFGEFDLFHTEVAFRDLTSGLNYSTSIDARYEVPNATLPQIVQNPDDGQVDLVWCNQAALCWKNTINDTYFDPKLFPSAYTIPVARVSGDVVNDFISWLPTANATYGTYELFNVYSSWPGGDRFIHSHTCYDYSWDVFDRLAAQGVVFDAGLQLSHDYINLFSADAPVKVDDTDPAVKADLVRFYTALATLTEKGHTIIDIINILEGPQYIYAGGSYYQLTPTAPFLDYHYAVDPLPAANTTAAPVRVG